MGGVERERGGTVECMWLAICAASAGCLRISRATLNTCAMPFLDLISQVLGRAAQTLLEVLAARLVDIQEWWATGALQVGFRVRVAVCVSRPLAVTLLQSGV